MKLAGPVVFEGLPLCQKCFCQHEGACPTFPQVVRPCPCSFQVSTHKGTYGDRLLCPTSAHEAWKAYTHKERNP
jgi:hypothetical protein